MSLSPELAGGAGFTFEGAVSAFYLTSLLVEGHAPGIEDRVVTKVSLQQRDLGSPLDDLIVDARGADGSEARLSLQCKRRLTISSAASNVDFAEIVRDGWATMRKSDFRENVDRIGAATGDVAMASAHALRLLCEAARGSTTTVEFDARFAPVGNASEAMRRIRTDVAALLGGSSGAPASSADVQRFLAHFVLVEFDFLHAGAIHPPLAIDRLAACLDGSDRDKAPLLWSRLQTLARDGAGTSTAIDRPRLLVELAPLAKLRTGASLAGDLAILRDLANGYVETIPDDVGGVRLNRPGLELRLDEALKTGRRLIQLRGLAGSGKSVLLRARVRQAVAAGPVVFLKADQLEGRSWRAHAGIVGLSASPLRSLLAEIGATGTPVLFVDAIDRVEIAQQPIVAEALRLIAHDATLSAWKVVVSVRDSGVEVLRNWLDDVLQALGVATVSIGALEDDEARDLANALPQLRPLLFGPRSVRDVARRPFFAKILVQGQRSIDADFEPRTEVDLADHWWLRGGYDAAGRDALLRQRAILEMAALRARSPSGPILMTDLSPRAVDEVDGLVVDGIAQWAKTGHSIRFTHDIFFEWSFYHHLEDADARWMDRVREIGEPPAVARSVELFAQARFAAGAEWKDSLHALATSGMRAQWLRAWLLGPIGSSALSREAERYWSALQSDDHQLMRKMLVWFQAERTMPNPNVMAAEGLDPDLRQQAADFLGWPSDFVSWMRLVSFLDAVADDVPKRLYPEIVAVFEVWQRSLGHLPQPASAAIVERCAAWLASIDARERGPAWRSEPAGDERPSAQHEDETNRATVDGWKDVAELGDFRNALIDIVLRAAKTHPASAEAYLLRVLADQEQLDRDIGRILASAPVLAAVHPALLADATFKHLRDDLPEETIAEDEKRNRNAADMRVAALAKPEEERSRVDKAAIEGAFFTLGTAHFSTTDWTSLSLDRGLENFSPTSPLREPFPSLFMQDPDMAFDLLRRMSAHAMEAWRQLHRHDRAHGGTPIPFNVRFPWGDQLFWGSDREFAWHRDLLAPNALACALLALENWAFAELERGIAPGLLIRRIVEGNECIAVLGVAVTVALESNLVSPVSLALLTCQRLLLADRHRMRQEYATGFGMRLRDDRETDRSHTAAMAELNGRAVRRRLLENLVPLFLVGPGLSRGSSSTSSRLEHRRSDWFGCLRKRAPSRCFS